MPIYSIDKGAWVTSIKGCKGREIEAFLHPVSQEQGTPWSRRTVLQILQADLTSQIFWQLQRFKTQGNSSVNSLSIDFL